MIDTRLAACGTTYLDAFYIHGIGTREYGEDSAELAEERRLQENRRGAEKFRQGENGRLLLPRRAADRLFERRGGRRISGHHHAPVQSVFPKGGPFDKALDAAHKAGIGLVAMKTMRSTKDVPKRLPEFDKLGLTTHQAVLHAAWSDPRISVVCNMIDNVDQMQSSTAAARSYKEPLKFAHMELLKETILAGRRTMCTGCPACEAVRQRRSDFAFQDIARFVTYYEQDGNTEARDYYQALAAAAPRHQQSGSRRAARRLPFQDRLSGNHPPRRTLLRLSRSHSQWLLLRARAIRPGNRKNVSGVHKVSVHRALPSACVIVVLLVVIGVAIWHQGQTF